MGASVVKSLGILALAAAVAVGSPGAASAGPAFGIEGRFLTSEEIAALFNVEITGGGVLIERVVEDSPAARAGLLGGSVPASIMGDSIVLGGDLILQIEAHKVCAGACLPNVREELERLSWVGVTYLRRGRVERTVIDLSEAPPGP